MNRKNIISPKWEEHIKNLPDDVRIALAEYAAQQYLDGVKKGKEEGRREAAEIARGNEDEIVNVMERAIRNSISSEIEKL